MHLNKLKWYVFTFNQKVLWKKENEAVVNLLVIVVSLTGRLGYLKTISTSRWQIISTSEVFSSYVFSSLNSVVLKSS